jgi:large subunit ribosomal protein L29
MAEKKTTKKTTAKKPAKKSVKKSDTLDVTKMSKEELTVKLVTLNSDLAEAYRSHAARELANTQRLRELRKDIARVNTALNNTEEKA